MMVMFFVITDHLMAVFIKEANMDRLQAGFQREGFNIGEDGVAIVAFFELVVRNAGAKVVNMVKADIPREPLQQLR